MGSQPAPAPQDTVGRLIHVGIGSLDAAEVRAFVDAQPWLPAGVRLELEHRSTHTFGNGVVHTAYRVTR